MHSALRVKTANREKANLEHVASALAQASRQIFCGGTAAQLLTSASESPWQSAAALREKQLKERKIELIILLDHWIEPICLWTLQQRLKCNFTEIIFTL